MQTCQRHITRRSTDIYRSSTAKDIQRFFIFLLFTCTPILRTVHQNTDQHSSRSLLYCEKHSLTDTRQHKKKWSRDSNSVFIMLRAGNPMNLGSITGRGKGFFSFPEGNDGLQPTKPPTQWVSWVLSSQQGSLALQLFAQIHLVSRLSISGATPLLCTCLHGAQKTA